jgi:hypothetical protein
MNITPAELDNYLRSVSIDNATHSLLLGEVAEEDDSQFSLFD